MVDSDEPNAKRRSLRAPPVRKSGPEVGTLVCVRKEYFEPKYSVSIGLNKSELDFLY